MKSFKKILVLICVLTLVAVGFVFATLVAGAAGTVEDLEDLVATAEESPTKETQYEAILAVVKYAQTVDPKAEGYSNVMVRAYNVTISCATAYLDTVAGFEDGSREQADAAYVALPVAHELINAFEFPKGTAGLKDVKTLFDASLVKGLSALVKEVDADIENNLDKTAENQVAINKVYRIIEECPTFGDASVLYDSLGTFTQLAKKHEAAVKTNYDALDAKNAISNYNLPIFAFEDWQKSNVGWKDSNIGNDWTVQYQYSKNLAGVQAEADGNRYMAHQYNDASAGVTGSSFAQINYTKEDFFKEKFTSENGFVIEFDITTFDRFPEFGLLLETGSINGKYPPHYIYINGNGDICANNKSTVLLPNAIVKGQWLHIVIVLDPAEFVYKVYVAGQEIGTYGAKLDGQTYDHRQVALRFSSGGKSAYGDFAIDNLMIYGGNNYRNHDRFAEMNDNDKFITYVNYFLDENNAVIERCNAYDYAKELLPKYWVVDEETGVGSYTDIAQANLKVKNALDSYLTFDLDGFLKEVGLANLAGYVELVKKLDGVDRTPKTVSERQLIVEEIDKFVEKNVDLLDRDSDTDGKNGADYIEYNLIYQTLVQEINYDYNAPAFIRFMQRFVSSETLTAMERNYSNAKKLIDEGLIDFGILRDETHPAREAFADLLEAYDIYLSANDEIYRVTKNNNAYKIVFCMDLLDEYTTEAEWLENEEYMLEYLYLVKNIVLGVDSNGARLYDESYVGVKDAVAFFNKAYGFFYARQQVEHVAFIQDVLDRILTTEQYIEKMGMISLLEVYIAENEVDLNDARIKGLVEDIDTCKAELVLRKEDYANVLRQNAVYFTNLVERMRTAETYDEQRMYFEEASLLYFNLDATVGNTANAIEIFDEYKVKLDIIEECSINFLNSVSIYNACQTEEEKYAALVECYYNAQFAELSYEGVADAMAEYRTAYNEYVDYAESVNEDVTETGAAIGSFRVNLGIVNVISMIIEMVFGK